MMETGGRLEDRQALEVPGAVAEEQPSIEKPNGGAKPNSQRQRSAKKTYANPATARTSTATRKDVRASNAVQGNTPAVFMMLAASRL